MVKLRGFQMTHTRYLFQFAVRTSSIRKRTETRFRLCFKLRL